MLFFTVKLTVNLFTELSRAFCGTLLWFNTISFNSTDHNKSSFKGEGTFLLAGHLSSPEEHFTKLSQSLLRTEHFVYPISMNWPPQMRSNTSI